MMSLWRRTSALASRHVLVGAFCALLNIGIIYVGTSLLGAPYHWAAISTCFITIPIGYLLLRKYSFRVSGRPNCAEIVRFLSQQLVQFLAGFALLAAGVELAQLDPTIAMVLATFLLWIFAFLSQWLWVFKERHPPAAASYPHPPDTHAHSGGLVIVTPFFPAHGGGLERVAAELASRLAGEFPVVWFSSDTDPKPPAEDRLRAISAPTINIVERLTQLPYPLWTPRVLPALWRAIGEAAIVHVHEHLYFPSMLGIAMAKLRGRPVVVTQHMGALALRSYAATIAYEVGARVLGAAIFPFVSRVVFISDNVVRFFGRARSANTRLIFNGVDTRIFNRASDGERENARNRLGLPAAGKIALFVGRLVRKKGIHRVEALARMFPEVTVVFVGSGPELPNAHALNVVLAGRIEHDTLPMYYHAADLLVLPSSGEGFPLVVQEALCCGTAVLSTEEVATACPGAASLIRTFPTPRDDDHMREWLEAARLALSDMQYLEDREQRSIAARSMWSWDRCSMLYARQFHEISH